MCHPENWGKVIPTFDELICFKGVGEKPTQAVTNLLEEADSFGFLWTEILHSNHFRGGG